MDLAGMDLTERQRREYEYHRERAYALADTKAAEPIAMDVLQPDRRRWWNAYWFTYTCLLGMDLRGKRVLIPGCGFGEDAVRLAAMGAQVYACDLSVESLDIARRRAGSLADRIQFDSFACEDMRYPDNFFDMVLFLNMLHHVDIPRSIEETIRILRPGALVVGNELYTHSWIQKVRDSALVSRGLYPRMRRYIYGTEDPYITEDEHKIDERELDLILSRLQSPKLDYFALFSGRLVPVHWHGPARIDRLALMALGRFGRVLAGRVLFMGTVGKGHDSTHR